MYTCVMRSAVLFWLQMQQFRWNTESEHGIDLHTTHRIVIPEGLLKVNKPFFMNVTIFHTSPYLEKI